MSACISAKGEFGAHELTNPAEPFTCQWCWGFDDAAATSRLLAARRLVGDWQANGGAAPLGDPTADVWHKAATQLLAVLDGGER